MLFNNLLLLKEQCKKEIKIRGVKMHSIEKVMHHLGRLITCTFPLIIILLFSITTPVIAAISENTFASSYSAKQYVSPSGNVYFAKLINGDTEIEVSRWDGSRLHTFPKATATAAGFTKFRSTHYDVAADLNGNLHLVAVKYGAFSEPRMIKYGYFNGTSWSFTTLDSSNDPNGFIEFNNPAISVDSQNKAHIVFDRYDANTGVFTHFVKYATNKSGTWDISLINTSNSSNFDIALDNQNNVHVSYVINRDVYYTKKGSLDSVFSTQVKVVDVNDVGVNEYREDYYSPLVVDESGNAYFSYGEVILDEANDYALKFSKSFFYSNKSGSWQREQVYSDNQRITYPAGPYVVGSKTYLLMRSLSTDYPPSDEYYFAMANFGSGWIVGNKQVQPTQITTPSPYEAKSTYFVDTGGDFSLFLWDANKQKISNLTGTSIDFGLGIAQNSTLNPTSATFDKNIGSLSYTDVTTTITLNGNFLNDITIGGTSIGLNNYIIDGNKVTIKKEYLATLETGVQVLTFDMNAGIDPTISIAVENTLSTNANLQSLTITPGSLTFSPSTTTYTVTVPYGTTSVTVTPTLQDTTATMKVNGVTRTNGEASPVTLDVDGSTVIPIHVTAQDGTTTMAYTIILNEAAPSNNGYLSTIQVDGNEVVGFVKTNYDYTLQVPFGTGAIDVDWILDQPATQTLHAVRVDGVDQSISSINDLSLTPGVSRVIEIEVKAQNGAVTTYTLSVTESLSDNGFLTSLSINGTAVTGFAKTNYTYSMEVPFGTSSIDVDWILDQPGTQTLQAVKVDGVDQVIGPINNLTLIPGVTRDIKIEVKAQNGAVTTYTLSVTESLSNNGYLSSLNVNGTPVTGFAKTDYTYSMDVPFGTGSIDVDWILDQPDTQTLQAVKVDGVDQVIGPINHLTLIPGVSRDIKIEVKAQNGSVTTYMLSVTESLSDNGYLSSLNVNGTSVSGFEKTELDYSMKVPFGTGSIDVDWVLDQPASQTLQAVRVDGINQTIGPIYDLSLTPGVSRVIEIEVKAQNGSVKTYNLIVTRNQSNISELTSLSLDGVTLSPLFHGGIYDYTSTVTHDVYGTTITAIPIESDAKVTYFLNNQELVSQTAQLSVGSNVIGIEVTAPDQNTKSTYHVTIIRAGSNNTRLNGLTTGAGLQPSFSTENYTYTADVPYSVHATTVTASVYDPYATLTINGVFIASDIPKDISLNVGDNLIPIVVTAQNGVDTATYTVNIQRAGNNDVDLSNLVLSEGTLNPVFSPHTMNYKVDVAHAISKLSISGELKDEHATLLINGSIVNNGHSTEIPLQVGSNVITLVVTAQDGKTTKTYNIDVYRAKDNDRHSDGDSRDSGSGTNGNPSGTIREAKVEVGLGQRTSLVAKVEIVRQVQKGYVQDQVTLDAQKSKEVVSRAVQSNQSTVRIVIDDIPHQPANQVNINVPKEALKELTLSHMNLQMIMNDVKITLPSSTLQGIEALGIDLYFRVVPIKEPKERETVVDRTIKAEEVQSIAGLEGVEVLGTPMTIETNYTNQATKVMFPLTGVPIPSDVESRETFIQSLAIYIEHSDGEKKVQTGEIVYDEQGNPIGIEIETTKFSTFTIISVKKSGEKRGYISGYPGGQFGPNQSVTRAEIASMLSKLLSTTEQSEAEVEYYTFADVPKGHWAEKSIQHVQRVGLMKGYLDQTFHPQQPITRAELAAIVNQVKRVDIISSTTQVSDIQGHWAEHVIQGTLSSGWMKGYLDGSFKPNQSVTRAEVVTVLNHVFKIPRLTKEQIQYKWKDVPKNHWAILDIESASSN